MIKTLIVLFSKSYDFISEYNKESSLESLIKKQSEYNFYINNLILKNLNFISNENFSHQFFLDSLNYYLKSHLSHRIFIYRKSLGKSLFILFSVLSLSVYSIQKLMLGFSHNLNFFDLSSVDLKNKKFISCFGFPDYSFSYQIEPKYPSSFIEYLNFNHLIPKDVQILSIDEYSRLSRKTENKKHFKLNTFNRVNVNKKRCFKNILNIPRYIFKSFLEFKKTQNSFSPLLFFYYYEKYSRSILIKDLIDDPVYKKLKIKNTYALSLYDIGSLKYSHSEKFNFFNYSKNCFIPPAKTIYDNILNNNKQESLNLILNDITINVLSMYHHNQINLNYHFNCLNSIYKKIKKKYGVSLQKSYVVDHNLVSNLGFEEINKIRLSSKQKNILLFDLPIETLNETLGRQFTGDLFASNKFLNEFYKEIIYISNKHQVKLFLKPKYSIHKKHISKFYDNIIKQLNNNNINFEIIDPYDKIDIGERKFDVILNLPYTSTYYTMSSLSKKNFYYLPLSYFKHLGYKSENLIDCNRLSKILKN